MLESSLGEDFRKSLEETRTTLVQLRSEIEALQGTEIDITPG